MSAAKERTADSAAGADKRNDDDHKRNAMTEEPQSDEHESEDETDEDDDDDDDYQDDQEDHDDEDDEIDDTYDRRWTPRQIYAFARSRRNVKPPQVYTADSGSLRVRAAPASVAPDSDDGSNGEDSDASHASADEGIGGNVHDNAHDDVQDNAHDDDDDRSTPRVAAHHGDGIRQKGDDRIANAASTLAGGIKHSSTSTSASTSASVSASGTNEDGRLSPSMHRRKRQKQKHQLSQENPEVQRKPTRKSPPSKKPSRSGSDAQPTRQMDYLSNLPKTMRDQRRFDVSMLRPLTVDCDERHEEDQGQSIELICRGSGRVFLSFTNRGHAAHALGITTDLVAQTCLAYEQRKELSHPRCQTYWLRLVSETSAYIYGRHERDYHHIEETHDERLRKWSLLDPNASIDFAPRLKQLAKPKTHANAKSQPEVPKVNKKTKDKSRSSKATSAGKQKHQNQPHAASVAPQAKMPPVSKSKPSSKHKMTTNDAAANASARKPQKPPPKNTAQSTTPAANTAKRAPAPSADTETKKRDSASIESQPHNDIVDDEKDQIGTFFEDCTIYRHMGILDASMYHRTIHNMATQHTHRDIHWDDMCIACQCRTAIVVFHPCHHRLLCENCSLESCPRFCAYCRTDIEYRILPINSMSVVKPAVFS